MTMTCYSRLSVPEPEAVFDKHGNLLTRSRSTCRPIVPSPGWAEQDLVFWSAYAKPASNSGVRAAFSRNRSPLSP